MKGIGKKAAKLSLALALVLSISLIPAVPTAQASVGNQVNMDFFKAYIYSTESDSVGSGETLTAETIVTGAGLNNPDDVTDENVVGPSLNGGPLLTFTPGAVAVDGYEMQDFRPESEYIWDIPAVPENEGQSRSVAIAPEGVSFQPDFTVIRSFSNPDDPSDPDPTEFPGSGTYFQTLNINTTPAESMMELVIIVYIPDNPLLTATITGATGDGIADESPNHVQISIVNPDLTTYTHNITIQVEVPGGGGSFKPEMQVIAWYNVPPGDLWDITDYTVTRTMELGTWTLGTWTWDTTSESYDRNWNEQLAKVVVFPGSQVTNVNRVNASFETGQTYNTEGNEVTNAPITTEPIWINSHLHNQDDGTGADVVGLSSDGGPLLYLTAENVTRVDEQYLLSGTPPETEYTWGYPPIPQGHSQQGYAELGDLELVTFQTGFNVEREVNSTTFTSAGGTQVLTLRVTPEEAMQRLEINGQVQISEQVMASIVSVEYITDTEPPEAELPEGMEIGFGDGGFGIGVQDPQIGQTYEWKITIIIGASDPPADIEFMPFVQVRNIVAVIENGQVYDSSLERVTTYGTWNWQAEGDYLWDWVERVVKEANLNGYAQVLYDYQAKDVATEGHFHLRSTEGLHLYEGEVVPDGSQSINGNLFTFTHPGTPSWAEITSWSYMNDVKPSGHIIISGTFTITVYQQEGFEFGNNEGTISFSFNAQSYAVAHPLCEECEPYHYNFQGPFQITGGTGFYEGISGSGTIGGTFHDHEWSGQNDPLETWFDFVMIGKARFPGN